MLNLDADLKYITIFNRIYVLLVSFCFFNACVEQEDEEASTGSHLKLIVDAFLQQLPNCVNRDLIDKVQ